MSKLTKTQVAYHEAGHVVVAFVLGCPIRDVTIHDPRGGMVRPQKNSGADPGVAVAIALAGPLAQPRRFPRSKWIDGWDGWYACTPGSDYWKVNALIESVIAEGGDRDELIAWRTRVENVVEQIITEDWDAICRVAKALLNGTLTGRQARKIAQVSP
jgi:hypothetical protein